MSFDNENKTVNLGKSHEFCSGRHCFSYCSWSPVQQKSHFLIGLNCILLCLNNSSQIAKRNNEWFPVAFIMFRMSVNRFSMNKGMPLKLVLHYAIFLTSCPATFEKIHCKLQGTCYTLQSWAAIDDNVKDGGPGAV